MDFRKPSVGFAIIVEIKSILMMKSYESILIATVTKVEAQTILETFSKASGKEWCRRIIGDKTYYDLGIHGGVPVFMVQSEMGAATPGGALLTVSRAIRNLQPQAVIMCGIAFGLHQDRQQLGDILIAKQIQCYEFRKTDIQRNQIARGDCATASERLLDRFRSGDNDWKEEAQTCFGLVLSGEKLINDPGFRDSLLKEEPEAIGGEMEGAGLYAAARDAKVDWILVKAICDWADGAKNSDSQSLAARNAAQFLLHVLQLGGWDRPGKNKLSHPNTPRSFRKPDSDVEQLDIALAGNPFQVGGPIRGGENFILKGNIVEIISQHMRNRQHVSLRGERLTGKTSLLLYLAHMPLPENHLAVYFNFQEVAKTDIGQIWTAIAYTIADKIKQKTNGGETKAGHFLKAAEKAFANKFFASGFTSAFSVVSDTKIHLLFDEFEKTENYPEREDFYGILRSLVARAANISYVIATRTDLAALQPGYNKFSSPFFNIFTTLILMPFQEDEVQKLIYGYFTRAKLNIFLADKLCDALPSLYDLTGYHPFFFQSYCYYLCMDFDALDWPEGEAKKRALRAFQEEASPHFKYYWAMSSDEEKTLFRKIATNQPIDWDKAEIKALVNKAGNRCLLVRSHTAWNNWSLFSSLFSDWIKDEHPNVHTDADKTRHGIVSSGAYIVGPPIKNPEDFFGRDALVRDFYETVVEKKQLHSLTIRGLRRTGKTSFLRYVSHPEILARYDVADANNCIMILLDMSSCDSPRHFYKKIKEKLSARLTQPDEPARHVIEKEDGADQVEAILSAFPEHRFIFLLDEFEHVKPGSFDRDFLIRLRSLASEYNYNLAYVIASSDDLYSIGKTMGLPRTSPFYNMFYPSTLYISGLETSEAEALIRDPAQSKGVNFTGNEVVSILGMAGSLPFLLQAAAEKWFTNKLHKKPFNKEDILTQLIDEKTHEFTHWWRCLNEQEHELLHDMALRESNDNPISAKSGQVVKRLKEYGLIIEHQGRFIVNGKVFSNWIKQV